MDNEALKDSIKSKISKLSTEDKNKMLRLLEQNMKRNKAKKKSSSSKK